MPRFVTMLHVTQTDRDRWTLQAPLIYESEIIGYVRVPAGFVTDFASVPRLPLMYMLAGGKATAPSVVHDYLYSTREVSRRTADAVFHEATRVSGHGAFTASLMWAGVRMGGWHAWRAANVPQTCVDLPAGSDS
jgi:hypothetical protein